MTFEDIKKSKYPNYAGGKDILGYFEKYENHLPSHVCNFLEIGIAMGDSIQMFRDYYGGVGNFHAMNMNWNGAGICDKKYLQDLDFICHEGDQGDIDFLNKIYTKFDVIVEDGSHHSDDQIVTFKHMFKHNLRDGGFYVLEDDLHCCNEDYWWRRVKTFEDTMLAVLHRLS